MCSMLLGTYNEAFLPARTCKYNKNRKYAKKNKKKLSCKMINNLATLLPTFLFQSTQQSSSPTQVASIWFPQVHADATPLTN